MAPSRKVSRKNPSRKISRKPLKKKEIISSSKLCFDDDVNSNFVLAKKDEKICSVGCTTPKAQKYQIPEILTCPPAPKKRRLVTSCNTLRRPISFFDPPDIELFFASHLTSIYNRVHTHASIIYGIQEGACVPNSLKQRLMTDYHV
ncbi:hypothetical protein QVD17_11322 [Tagetes erecta]|uniref:Uncharacterized protein n=1 Tax=Tagetes erecta TaxID=13708 RepID=A0AAD8NUT8_TARER|nr:hypothetical protein QVD17_11322 [Tagetes erecta]